MSRLVVRQNAVVVGECENGQSSHDRKEADREELELKYNLQCYISLFIQLDTPSEVSNTSQIETSVQPISLWRTVYMQVIYVRIICGG